MSTGAFLDTNFPVHLDIAGLTCLVGRVRDSEGWDFYMARAVRDELARKRIGPDLRALVDALEVVEPRAGPPPAGSGHRGLGPGELETIRAICRRPDAGDCLILTSDARARKRARNAGIRSYDLLGFLVFCNRRGLLRADRVLEAVDVLESNRYRLSEGLKRRLPGRLAGY